MTNSISLNDGRIQTELWIGNFQAGKTSSAVQHAYETNQINTKIIPVFYSLWYKQYKRKSGKTHSSNLWRQLYSN